jgi:transposase
MLTTRRFEPPDRHPQLRERLAGRGGDGYALHAATAPCAASARHPRSWCRHGAGCRRPLLRCRGGHRAELDPPFNQGGIDALLDKARCGRPRLLTAQRFRAEVVPLLENPASAGQHHWTAVKLHGHLAGHLQISLGYSTLVRHLHEHGWVLRIPRPWLLPPSDERWHAQRADFLPGFKALLSDPRARVFFGDEPERSADRLPQGSPKGERSESMWRGRGSAPALDMGAQGQPSA